MSSLLSRFTGLNRDNEKDKKIAQLNHIIQSCQTNYDSLLEELNVYQGKEQQITDLLERLRICRGQKENLYQENDSLKNILSTSGIKMGLGLRKTSRSKSRRGRKSRRIGKRRIGVSKNNNTKKK